MCVILLQSIEMVRCIWKWFTGICTDSWDLWNFVNWLYCGEPWGFMLNHEILSNSLGFAKNCRESQGFTIFCQIHLDLWGTAGICEDLLEFTGFQRLLKSIWIHKESWDFVKFTWIREKLLGFTGFSRAHKIKSNSLGFTKNHGIDDLVNGTGC